MLRVWLYKILDEQISFLFQSFDIFEKLFR